MTDSATEQTSAATPTETAATAPAATATMTDEQAAKLVAQVRTDDLAPGDLASLDTEAGRFLDQAMTNKGDLSTLSKFAQIGQVTQSGATEFLNRHTTDLNKLSILQSTNVRGLIDDLRLQGEKFKPTGLDNNVLVRFAGVFGQEDRAKHWILAHVVDNIETISESIDKTVDGLAACAVKGQENNVVISTMDKQLASIIKQTRANQYMLKCLDGKIQAAQAATTDQATLDFLSRVRNTVLRRLYYLLWGEQMYSQQRLGYQEVFEVNQQNILTLNAQKDIVAQTLKSGIPLVMAAQETIESQRLIDAADETMVNLARSTAEATGTMARSAADMISGRKSKLDVMASINETMLASARALQASYQQGNERMSQEIPMWEANTAKLQQYLKEEPGQASQTLDAANILTTSA